MCQDDIDVPHPDAPTLAGSELTCASDGSMREYLTTSLEAIVGSTIRKKPSKHR